ncbi:MAG: ribokinase, partial [Clostridia bacterium]
IMIGAIGNDIFGEKCLESISSYGVDTSLIQKVCGSTGIALITVVNGDNCIVLDSGANSHINENIVIERLEQCLQSGDIVLSQLEIPMEQVIRIFDIAKRKNATTILNPAPATKLPLALLEKTDIIVPNEIELYVLTDKDNSATITECETELKRLGVKDVVVTLGAKGCYYNGIVYPAYKCEEVVDTIGAGDTFIGALASQLALGKSIEESINFCQLSAMLTVTKQGAQSSMPTKEEVVAELYRRTHSFEKGNGGSIYKKTTV